MGNLAGIVSWLREWSGSWADGCAPAIALTFLAALVADRLVVVVVSRVQAIVGGHGLRFAMAQDSKLFGGNCLFSSQRCSMNTHAHSCSKV